MKKTYQTQALFIKLPKFEAGNNSLRFSCAFQRISVTQLFSSERHEEAIAIFYPLHQKYLHIESRPSQTNHIDDKTFS